MITLDEAIEILLRPKAMKGTPQDVLEAHDMAITALRQQKIIHCRDCKHYYYADNRIPQKQRYVCDIGEEIWQPDDYCPYAERREVANEAR